MIARGLSGALWFDSVDAEDVPQLINVQGAFPAGLDLFDWAAPLPQPLPEPLQPVSTGAAGSNDPQPPQQPGQQEAVEQMEDLGQEAAQAAAAAAAAKPKKKALTRAEKKQLERAKNREIQARYRQRQREKRNTLEADHEAASADLLRMRAEHETLSHRNVLLESLLVVRDEEQSVLESAKEPESEDDGALVEFDAADGSFWAPPDSEDDSQYDLQYDSQHAAAGPGPSFREVATSEGSRSRSTGGGAAVTEGGSTGAATDEVQRQPPAGEAPQQQGQQQQLALSPWQRGGSRVEKIKVPMAFVERAKGMSREDYFQNWQEFVAHLRDILARYDLTHNPEALRDLEPLLKRRAVVMTLMLHHNPDCLKSLLGHSGREGRDPQEEGHFWDGLVEAMQLTAGQRDRYCMLWDSYSRKVERLREGRDSALNAIAKASVDSLSASAGGAGLSGMMSQYLRLLEGAASLSAYPDSEFTALLELLSGTGRILTPLQKARMAAWSYPFFPDVIQICSAIARQQEEARLGL